MAATVSERKHWLIKVVATKDMLEKDAKEDEGIHGLSGGYQWEG